MISFSQDKSIEKLYFQGVDLLENKKQHEEALTCFQQIIELDPGHAEAYFQIGRIFRNTRQLEKAITYYKNAALDEYKILKDLDQDTAEKLFDMIYK